jgi:hypothetical protein
MTRPLTACPVCSCAAAAPNPTAINTPAKSHTAVFFMTILLVSSGNFQSKQTVHGDSGRKEPNGYSLIKKIS